MSALADGLGRALSGITSEEGSTSFRDELDTLKRRHGGVSGLARYLGVHRTTVQRWQRSAVVPKALNRESVGREYRRTVVAPISTSNVRIKATSGGRTRTLTPDQLRLSPGAVAEARQTWIDTGSATAAAAALWRGIGDNFYKSFLGDEELFDSDDGFYPDLGSDYQAEAISVSL